jgi:hypothetical protein
VPGGGQDGHVHPGLGDDVLGGDGRDRRSGPPREGAALLQGVIICGRCGLRMTVRYHSRGRGQPCEVPTYMCQRDGIENGKQVCAAIPSEGLDQAIGQLLTGTLTPLAVEAALNVQAELEHRAEEADALRAAHAGRARYLADLARRRPSARASSTAPIRPASSSRRHSTAGGASTCVAWHPAALHLPRRRARCGRPGRDLLHRRVRLQKHHQPIGFPQPPARHPAMPGQDPLPASRAHQLPIHELPFYQIRIRGYRQHWCQTPCGPHDGPPGRG